MAYIKWSIVDRKSIDLDAITNSLGFLSSYTQKQFLSVKLLRRITENTLKLLITFLILTRNDIR